MRGYNQRACLVVGASSTLTRQPSSRQSAHGEGLGYEACPASTRTLCWLPVAPAQHLQLVLVLQNARHEAVGTPFSQPLRMTAWAAAPDPIHLFCRIRGPSRAGRPVIQPPGILVHRHRRDRLPDLSLSAPRPRCTQREGDACDMPVDPPGLFVNVCMYGWMDGWMDV